MQECWPEDYARVKSYVAAGRWFPAGSSMEEGDPVAASAGATVRQILYGSHYFRTLTLPDDDKLRILAVTVSDEGETVRPARPLFDSLERRP